MATVKIYSEDLLIAKALIQHDEATVREFFYKQSYPLFISIFDNYYTDCTCVEELINDIYVLVLAPSSNTGRCQMENYRGESSLISWLKTVCLYYCYNKFEKKGRMPPFEPIERAGVSEEEEKADRREARYGSCQMDLSTLNRKDAYQILNMMPNKRFRKIIELCDLEKMSNEETAEALGMTLSNFYNKHKLAKEQYEKVFRKEERHG